MIERAELEPIPVHPVLTFPLSQLIIDHEYQRELRPERVRKLVAEFDPKKMAPLTVNIRGDGTVAVVDGQHRRAALLQLPCDPTTYMVPCVTHTGLSVEDEAETFDEKNGPKYNLLPSRADTLKARVKHGNDPVAREVWDIITSSSMTPYLLRQTSKLPPGHLVAAAVEKIAQAYGLKVARETVRAIDDAYGNTHVIPSRFVMGVAKFLSYSIDHEHYKYGRFVEILKLADPSYFMNEGRNIAQSVNVRLERGISLAILRRYNYKRQRTLPAIPI